jgi:hypothetical protein
MKKKFIVSYEIGYVHRVAVGIEALNETEAQQLAEQAFYDATLWDDTEAMPLCLMNTMNLVRTAWPGHARLSNTIPQPTIRCSNCIKTRRPSGFAGD